MLSHARFGRSAVENGNAQFFRYMVRGQTKNRGGAHRQPRVGALTHDQQIPARLPRKVHLVDQELVLVLFDSPAARGKGLGVKGLFNTLLPQITGSFKTLWPGAEFVRDASFGDRFAVGAENLIYVVGTVSVLMYFFFAFGRKHWGIQAPAKLGRWYLMLSLGAFFGNTFMSRLSALIERIHFLFSEWLRWSSP